jgi:hypothetical protein
MDIVLPEVTLLEADFSNSEHLMKMLDQNSHVMRLKKIKFFKVQWSHHIEDKATWESNDFLHSRRPDFEL